MNKSRLHSKSRTRQRRSYSPRRGGAVIIMVVSLMSTLLVLGLFFYSWTKQERINSEFFASTDPLEIDPDPIFDFGLRQVLVSTDSSLQNSALYGNHWSLLAHIMGPIRSDGAPLNAHPYSGKGITIDPTGANLFTVDYESRGISANFRNQSTFVLNFSPLTNSGNDLLDASSSIGGTNTNFFFNPAAGYTYPDINSLFLALDYVDPVTGRRVIKPSFALPGYFPGLRTSSFSNWYTTASFENRVLRPHRSSTTRYVTSNVAAQSGDRNRIIQSFPFTMGNLGVWDGSGNTYDLDVDLDGDGIEDSIYVDLDHSLIELPNGRQVVPSFSFKIIDLDGLLNANAHGNMSDFTRRSRTTSGSIYDHIARDNTWAHRSNLGLTPSEVNPQIALYADPSDPDYIAQDSFKSYITLPHRGMTARRFDGMSIIDPPTNRIGVGSFDRLNMANIEHAMMLLGRPNFDPNDLKIVGANAAERRNGIVPGRYGLDRSSSAFDGSWLLEGLSNEGVLAPTPPAGRFNAPGIAGSDDDKDSNSATPPNSKDGGIIHTDPTLNMQIPPFVHPLDFGGTGNNGTDLSTPTNAASIVYRTASATTTMGERIRKDGGLMNNPMRWPAYPANGAWQNQGSGNSNYPTYRDAVSGNSLQPNSTDMLVDEEDERVIDSTFPDYRDARFLPSEIAALHLSDSDWNESKTISRLRSLAPFNFDFNRQASKIRSQFTSESWDRLQFAFSPYADDTSRAWEFNDNDRFPPRFNGAAASRHENNPPTLSAFDPFRPEIRRLLTIRDAAPNSAVDYLLPRRKLHLNRILADDQDFNGPSAFDNNSNPQYRHLVPHAINIMAGPGTSTNLSMAMPHRNDVAVAAVVDFGLVTSDKYAQEWWARYDRQRLARDIYVLLYTLAGHDGTGMNVDPPAASSPVQAPIDANMAREMAQFAVNYVDALDRDNVITEFVYDENLSDGWADPPTLKVYGIEAHQLTFSEVMLIATDTLPNDSPRTLHDESGTNGHRFLYIELRNASPFEIPLDAESWRIARISTSGGNEVLDQGVRFQPDGGTALTIGPGENFVIGCHDGTVANGAGQLIGSEFYVNINTDADGDPLQMIFPRSTVNEEVANNSATPNPKLDLDLTPRMGSNHANYRVWDAKDAASTFTGMNSLVEQVPTNDVGPAFTLLLQRRRNLKGDGEGESDWIEVDRIVVTPANFTNNSGDPFLDNFSSSSPPDPNQSDFQNELKALHSRERLHPFTNDTGNHPFSPMMNAGNTERNHTLNAVSHSSKDGANRRWTEANGTNPYDYWHPHFDRDYSSVIELLSVPLYGYRNAGDKSAPTDYDSTNRTNAGVVSNLTIDLSGEHMDGNVVGQQKFLNPDERWYRLLNFIEAPPRTQDVVENQIFTQRRTPGRINLNTIRHEHVLAGLIDDTVHHNHLVDRPTRDILEPNRWWVREFLDARDNDPVVPTGNRVMGAISLPGTHYAEPFRPLGYVSPNNGGDQTILRLNPNDSPAGLSTYGLFDARPVSDATNQFVDYHTQNRLLAKVFNNSTTRSHVFAMWVGVTFHEAHNDGGNIKLGAEADDLPRYRMFCVVDMSRLEEAYDPTSGTFDFRKFIIHRQQLP